MNGTKELFVWKKTEGEDCQMWCYAGGRRYLFANLLIKPKEDKCFGAIYDVDLDDLQIDLGQLDAETLEDINSIENDFERASAIAGVVEVESCSRTTPLYDDEEKVWEYVCSIKELLIYN